MQSAEATELTAVPVPSSPDWEEDERIAGPQWASVTIIVADVAVLPGAVTHIRRVVRMFPPLCAILQLFRVCVTRRSMSSINFCYRNPEAGQHVNKLLTARLVGRSVDNDEGCCLVEFRGKWVDGLKPLTSEQVEPRKSF